MNDQLSGTELENWFKNFALTKEIAARTIPSAGKVVTTIHRHVPERLNKALTFISKDIPDGRDLVSTLIQKPNTILPPGEDKQLSEYLFDKAVATDQLLEIRNTSGRYVRIAVDVTGNPEKLQEKLDRIQGFPDPKDTLGNNRNLNISKAQDGLGIDKHLILALNSELKKLPSYEKLLFEMQAFANAPERTRLTDLQNVPPSELYYAEPRYLQDAERLFNLYSQSTTQLDLKEQFIAVTKQAILDGHPKERVRDILLQHPFFESYRRRNQWSTAQALATNVYQAQVKEIQVGIQANENRPEPGSREDVLDAARYIAKELGERDGSGELICETDNFKIEACGENLKVWDNNGDKVIDIDPDSSRETYQPSPEFANILTSAANELEQQQFDREQESEQQVDEGFEY